MAESKKKFGGGQRGGGITVLPSRTEPLPEIKPAPQNPRTKGFTGVSGGVGCQDKNTNDCIVKLELSDEFKQKFERELRKMLVKKLGDPESPQQNIHQITDIKVSVVELLERLITES